MIVHFLLHGLPVCGFSNEMPVSWPPGHVWVGPGIVGPGIVGPGGRFNDVNCDGCKAEIQAKKEEKEKQINSKKN